jgi:ferredoxin
LSINPILAIYGLTVTSTSEQHHTEEHMQGIIGTGSLTFKLAVDDDLCRRCWGCLACLTACPFEAVVRTDYATAT